MMLHEQVEKFQETLKQTQFHECNDIGIMEEREGGVGQMNVSMCCYTQIKFGYSWEYGCGTKQNVLLKKLVSKKN